MLDRRAGGGSRRRTSAETGRGMASATEMLEQGNYVLLCFVPRADAVPHFAKGME